MREGQEAYHFRRSKGGQPRFLHLPISSDRSIKRTRGRTRYFSCHILLLLFLVAPSMTDAQEGALVLHQNLADLVDESATIIHGHVLSARSEKHPQFENLNTVVVTVKVRTLLRGSAGSTFTFRQYVWDARPGNETAGYHKAQQVLLLLIKPSEYGLSSPAGQEQGRFRILRDRQGKEYAVNSLGNAGLFHNMQARLASKGVRLAPHLSTLVRKHRSGAVALDQLESIIRALQGGR